jgi:hypothetical protein
MTWRVARRIEEDVLTIYVERAEHATDREGEAIALPEGS